jgi:glycosyltransferase involved in cell wall biosynthesis
MRIALMLPAVLAVNGPGNGVRVQVEQQANALEVLGHEVIRLNAWTPFDGRPFDILHGVSGGFPLQNFDRIGRTAAARVGLAPMLDTNEPVWRYRLAARLGRTVPKIYTVPGELSRQAHGCDVVVCRSESERRRVVGGLGVPAAKANIVLNGVGPPPAANPAIARQLLGFDGDFVLHLSSYGHARKNVERLIEAVGPTGIPLVIAGPTLETDRLTAVRLLTAKFPSVRLLGFLAPVERDALLAACRVFALPSEHEGTGLAALEAAAGGAAVVITNRGGASDYFGPHATYVSPYDILGIRRAVEAAMIAPRSGLLADHLRTVLTWRRSAEMLVEAYAAAGR